MGALRACYVDTNFIVAAKITTLWNEIKTFVILLMLFIKSTSTYIVIKTLHIKAVKGLITTDMHVQTS